MTAAEPTDFTEAGATGTPDEPVLRVDRLVVQYRIAGTSTRFEAVSGVSFAIRRGETFGIVGESGCGKSTMAHAIARFVPLASGSIYFEGVDVAAAGRQRQRELRRHLQLVFQDPIASLNPRRPIFSTVLEPLRVWRVGDPPERAVRVQNALLDVGLDPAAVGSARPHELSGGECQRVCLARALVLDPTVLICDEAVSALDLSVKGQVLNLLEDLKIRHGLGMIFISHDLAAVKSISDRIAVMYLGRLCEVGVPSELYQRPAHHYTAGLIRAIPSTDPTAPNQAKDHLGGEVPSPLQPPSGCRFRTRCPAARERCASETPVLREVEDNRYVACHYPLI